MIEEFELIGYSLLYGTFICKNMNHGNNKQQSQSQQQTLPPRLPNIPLPPFVHVGFPPPMFAPIAGTKRPHGQFQLNKPPTEEELNSKKAIRKAKNRESARICRLRKKEAAKELERKIQILEVENLKLRLQLKIGEEAEALDRSEEERLTRELEELVRSGAPEKEVDDSILCYTEKFADYGRDRRSAIEFHLRNVARLLKPTTTTSVAMRALEGTTDQQNTPKRLDHKERHSPDTDNSTTFIATEQENPSNTSSSTTKTGEELPKVTSSSAHDVTQASVPLEPKQLFQYLVDYLEVNELQSKALRDSRKVAKELDAALEQSLVMLEELKGRLTQCGSDLEVELDAISKILTPTQVAKFLVWVQNNGACMHMLNELWKKEYSESYSDNDDENINTHEASSSEQSSPSPAEDLLK